MDPCEETNVWSFEPEDRTGEGDKYYGPVDETYFVVRGRLRLTWDEGELDIGPTMRSTSPPGGRIASATSGTSPPSSSTGWRPRPSSRAGA
jgi:hypothetical protein